MTALALIALCVAAVAPLTLATPRSPRWAAQWAAPIVVVLALAVAAVAASATTPVTGFALAATLVLCVAAATTGGAPLVLAAFRIARRQPDAGADPRPDAGPLRGGRIIGLLERAAVAAAILAGWPEGIAVVLAVKGLARYPELREPHASEQFIIGTFTSVLWAIAVCGVGRALLT
jgi:F0F1-type ATP synthase membrane subunit c/vacuolar-type H+-ATPase subunit K